MNSPAITIKNVSKEYQISNPVKGEKRKVSFFALKDIDLEIPKGEVFGLIGPNGAGKSTLLKILSRITPPSSGSIQINGRISSLLEVGTGFHQELTGKENIFLNGAILGMHRQEIKRRFDEIVEFSGIEKFLNTPVKHYSSGMYVRLAFSVAAHLESEILLIDEILAVGDAEFQRKCIAKMEDTSGKQDRTVVFVSHNMNIARNLCQKIALLEEGTVQKIGPAEEIADFYLERMQSLSETIAVSLRRDRKGKGLARVTDIKIYNPSRQSTVLVSGEPAEITVTYRSEVLAHIESLEIELNIFNREGLYLTSLNNVLSGSNLLGMESEGSLRCLIEKWPLMAGNYYINSVLIINGSYADHLKRSISFSVLAGDYYKSGVLPRQNRSGIFVEQNWFKEK